MDKNTAPKGMFFSHAIVVSDLYIGSNIFQISVLCNIIKIINE